MSLRTMTVMVAGFVLLAAPAKAVVTYTLELPRGGGGFVWQTADYVRRPRPVDVPARALTSCDSGRAPNCVIVHFDFFIDDTPGAPRTPYDRIAFVTTDGGPFLYFNKSSFVRPGHRVSSLFNAGAVLNVATDAVPEPASWALLITGFGLTGAARRRRRRAALG